MFIVTEYAALRRRVTFIKCLLRFLVYSISIFLLILHYVLMLRVSPFIRIYSEEPTVYYVFVYMYVPRIIGDFIFR